MRYHQSMTDTLGIDIVATDDIDPHFRLCRGNENLAYAQCRRISSSPGCLESIGDDPNYGYNLPGHLNSELTRPSDLAAINGAARAEMLKDPRVQDVRPQIVATGNGELIMSAAGTTSDGPFEFVSAVGDMSIDRLKQGLPTGVPATQADIVGQSTTIISQTGAQGVAGPAGAPGTDAGSVEPNLDGLYSTDVASEGVLKQEIVDFTVISGTLAYSFSSFARALGGATGAIRLRLGGTDGAADGTLVATLTATSASFQMLNTSGTVSVASGRALIKLTGETSVAGLAVQVKSTVARFTPS